AAGEGAAGHPPRPLRHAGRARWAARRWLCRATTKAKANASGKSGEDEEDHHQGNAVDSADLVPPDDLIMLAEVAKLLGVAPSTTASRSSSSG
ncbi:MAG: hypothetical protein M3292_05775, partial [Actinomycetota bacterium]|nr:hypothetical protein [Actinomycetota bacterium]